MRKEKGIKGRINDLAEAFRELQFERVGEVKHKRTGRKPTVWLRDCFDFFCDKTMSSIVNFQKEYFLTGDETKMKPMILKDIAEKIEMDISTISRVANSKYVDTPYGIKLVKSFFSEGIKNSDGVEISTIEVKKTLEDIIENENKNIPYTDDQLTKLLNKKGYPIARRTVAKYREMIGAPVARLRKKL